MSFQEEITNVLNNAGMAANLSGLQAALLGIARNQINRAWPDPSEPGTTLESQKADLRLMLNSVGPAAAESALDHAFRVCTNRGQLSTIKHRLSNNQFHNFKVLTNTPECPVEEFNNFTNVARQFLLPRYAYLDFDNVVDPRHQIDLECGYPKFVTPIMYRYMYDRDDVARRVVDFYPNESWAASPKICEDFDESRERTPFEQYWEKLCDEQNILQMLYRMDKQSGIGHYGALLLGIDDGRDLEAPIQEQELLAGVRGSVGRTQRNLLYCRPFDEYLSFIHQYEVDVMSPRYGLPKFYNLVFLDMTIDAAGASIGTRLNRRVHWSRVVHVADNLQSSLVFGTPRMQPVFNRLLDLRKIKGGSAEMFWKGAFPGISFEIDPRFVDDDPEFDKESIRKEIREYSEGLRRYLTLIGIKANSLAPNISENPDKHVRLQLEAIAGYMDAPLRIFMGSEEGRLAASQDKLSWNQRLGRRCRMFTEPSLIRNFIGRLIAIGIMPPPSRGKYYVDWGDLNTTTDEDKANLALKWTQALSQYVSTGLIHFISPMDYLTVICGLKPYDAKRIVDYVMTQGGWEKLKKVDPAEQSAGKNGVAENNVTKGEKEGSSGGRPEPRNKADKEIEGKSG